LRRDRDYQDVVTLHPEVIRRFRKNLGDLHEALTQEITDEQAAPYRQRL
jgi:hypothetical protein